MPDYNPYDNYGGVYDNYTTGDQVTTDPSTTDYSQTGYHDPVYDPSATVNADGSVTGGQGTASTNLSDYTQNSDGTILDKLGNVIGKLASGQTAKDLISAWIAGHNNSQATALQNTLQTAAVNNLQDLANHLRDSSANPKLLQYVTDTAKAVSQGQIPAAQALASVQQQTKLNGIAIPQQFTDAINSTLSRLDTVAKNGYTPIERAAIQRALDQVSTQTRGEQEAIKTDEQARGQWGVGSDLVSRQMSQQNAANLAAQQGLDIQSAGLKRALDALTSEGNLAVTADNQSFGQQKDVASAQDAINANNAALAQQAAEQNAARAQAAAAANNAAAYHVQDTNIAQSNLEQQNQLKAAQQEFDNAQKQKEDAANVDVNAAKNASNMWGKTYDQQLATQKTLNDQAKTALAPAATTGSSSGGTNWGQVAGTVGNIVSSIWSDEKVKENKKELSDDDIENIFNELVPISYNYNKTVQRLGAPSGKVVGVMAQDLEKSPQGATLVIDTPAGKKVDADKALQLALAAIASMNGRIGNLEGK